jgi:amidase
MATLTAPTAVELAAAVRDGRRTAVEVVREHVDRIASSDGELNAFCSVRRSAALQEAALVDADPERAHLPMAGVPVAVKDNIAVSGEHLRQGSAATIAAPATADDPLVARLRGAGCVVVGTTRMPELAAWGFTSSRAGGPTRNPWDPALDPGGSTGGGAVAVATGMAAIALGTDGGGSLRIPAAACGLVGVKPGPGLVPLPGGAVEHWFGLTVAGPIARTAADAAAALSVLSGTAVAPQAASSGLRVAVSLRSPSPLGRPDAHQRAAVDVAAGMLRGCGHDLVRADPPYPPTLLNRWGRRWHAGIALEVQQLDLEVAHLEPRTAAMVRKGRRILRRGGPGRAVSDPWGEVAERWLADYDVLLTPVVSRIPGAAGALTERGYLGTYLAAAKAVPFCQAWNLAGFPAVTVPVGVRDRLPMVVQLVGRPGSESLLLGVATQIERPLAPPALARQA